MAEARGLGAVPGVGTAGVGGGEPILAADGVPVIGLPGAATISLRMTSVSSSVAEPDATTPRKAWGQRNHAAVWAIAKATHPMAHRVP